MLHLVPDFRASDTASLETALAKAKKELAEIERQAENKKAVIRSFERLLSQTTDASPASILSGNYSLILM